MQTTDTKEALYEASYEAPLTRKIGLKCTDYTLYDIKKYFQKYNWKYHLSAVLGTLIKWPKANITPQKNVFLKVNIFAVYVPKN